MPAVHLSERVRLGLPGLVHAGLEGAASGLVDIFGKGNTMSTMADTKGRRTRRSFTDDYKTGAVRLVLDEGKTVASASRDLGLTESSLRNWVEQARADRTKGKTGLATVEREELARLRGRSLRPSGRLSHGLAARDLFINLLRPRYTEGFLPRPARPLQRACRRDLSRRQLS